MRIIHQDGFSLDARMAYRAAIHSNLMESAVAVVLAMKKFEMESEDEVNRVRAFGASCVDNSNIHSGGC